MDAADAARARLGLRGCVAGALAAGAIAVAAVDAADARAPGARVGKPPKVVEFAAPRRFWCLPEHPGQAQVTVGWSVPAATRVAVLLDGVRVRSGIRRSLPFVVLAGGASGIGATVVFPCRSGRRHKLTIRWWSRSSPPSTRRITIRRATRR